MCCVIKPKGNSISPNPKRQKGQMAVWLSKVSISTPMSVLAFRLPSSSHLPNPEFLSSQVSLSPAVQFSLQPC